MAGGSFAEPSDGGLPTSEVEVKGVVHPVLPESVLEDVDVAAILLTKGCEEGSATSWLALSSPRVGSGSKCDGSIGHNGACEDPLPLKQ